MMHFCDVSLELIQSYIILFIDFNNATDNLKTYEKIIIFNKL